MKVILLEYPDGRVATRGALSQKFIDSFGNRTENGSLDHEKNYAQAFEYVLSWLVPLQNPGAVATVIDSSAIPADRVFRRAWVKSGQGVGIDLPAARAAARDMLREERAIRFKILDGQWMRATGRSDAATAAAIEAKREILRNWPQDQRIADCSSADALKSTVQAMKDDAASAA